MVPASTTTSPDGFGIGAGFAPSARRDGGGFTLFKALGAVAFTGDRSPSTDRPPLVRIQATGV
jgi:hypothetical protein